MPDSHGKMSRDEKQRAIDWLEEKTGGKDFACTVCGHTDWGVPDHIVSDSGYTTSRFFGSRRPIYPQLQVICRNCGHVVLFNAMVMGIVEKSQDDEEEEKEEGGKQDRTDPSGDAEPKKVDDDA